jgi:hypothetical protein
VPAQIGDNAAGVSAVSSILAAATNARWPMYLRNVKQILRAAAFDERRYGFGGLIDLLRACQRDGLVRMERDRRGALRVFQGSSLSRPGPRPASGLPMDVDDGQLALGIAPVAVPPPSVVEVNESERIIDTDADEVAEAETITVVDTTAELLGRAKHRRGRSGGLTVTDSPSAPAARGTRKSSGKKSSGGRRTRSRKSAGDSGHS